jgi:lipopolysaccharide export system permease protein
MGFSLPLLKRYVLVELLKIFAVALASLTVLMLIVGVMRQALDEGIGLKHVLLLLPYILPDALRFTIPATALFAAACVYGRMSGSNEVVALKSLGISPLTILWPTYLFAFVLSLLTVCLNDVAVSWGREGARRVVLRAIEDIVLSRLEMRKEYSTRDFSVVVRDVQDRRLIEPTFTYRKRSQVWTLRCQYARLESNGEVLVLRCYSGSADVDGETEFRFPDSEFVREFELEDFRQDDTELSSPSNMALAAIVRLLDDHPRKMEQLQREHAVKAALQLVAADFDALARGEWGGEQRAVDHQTYLYNRLRTEPPRRWANGFSCLSFVMVGSAMAIRLRNSNALSSFFVCFLPILIVYYPLLVLGVNQAKNGALPPMVVWLGNVVLGVWGLWLLRRVMRY